MGQVSPHREVNRVGIRCFDGLVDSPGDRLASRVPGRWSLRERSWRRSLEVRTAELVRQGNAMDGITARTTGATNLVLNAGHLSGPVNAARIRQRSREACRGVGVKRVHQLHARAIINDAESAADDGLIRRAKESTEQPSLGPR